PRLAPAAAQGLRELRHLARELRPRQRRARAVLSDEHRRLTRQLLPPVGGVRGDVDAAADEPARPLDPVRGLEDARPSPREDQPQVVDEGRPEALRLLDRDTVELVVARAAEQPREPGQVCRLYDLGSRFPDDVSHCRNITLARPVRGGQCAPGSSLPRTASGGPSPPSPSACSSACSTTRSRTSRCRPSSAPCPPTAPTSRAPCTPTPSPSP